MKVVSVRKVSSQKLCARCKAKCYGSYEAALESGESLPLCSACYAHVAEELSQGQVVDIPLKSARL